MPRHNFAELDRSILAAIEEGKPDHLFLGTDADNTADKVAKGRWRGRWTPVDQLIHPQLSKRVKA